MLYMALWLTHPAVITLSSCREATAVNCSKDCSSCRTRVMEGGVDWGCLYPTDVTWLPYSFIMLKLLFHNPCTPPNGPCNPPCF